MSQMTTDAQARIFKRDGRPFFVLADTVWSIFLAARDDEWQEYLAYRSAQGFNVLQTSLLPILHDASPSEENLFPFHYRGDGSIDLYHLNEAYFQRVETMVKQAAEQGITCALTLLWLNYAPNTWASKDTPQFVMPTDAIEAYVEYTVKLLDTYNPIYIISGDTDLQTQETIDAYLTALKVVKKLAPTALTCFHLSPPVDLPPQMAQSGIDFYMYQSGHTREDQHQCYTLAEHFYQKEPHLPVMNGEPCYEGHGHGNHYARYGADAVRMAFWQSVLSGASAGFTYGAHGTWSWHHHGMPFNNEAWSKTPFDWHTALHLPGAWDVAFGKWLFERYQGWSLLPHVELLETPYQEIRAASTADLNTIMIYLPASVNVQVKHNLSGYTVEGIDLGTRNVFRPRVVVQDSGSTLIEMAEFNSDCLLIATRNQ